MLPDSTSSFNRPSCVAHVSAADEAASLRVSLRMPVKSGSMAARTTVPEVTSSRS